MALESPRVPALALHTITLASWHLLPLPQKQADLPFFFFFIYVYILVVGGHDAFIFYLGGAEG